VLSRYVFLLGDIKVFIPPDDNKDCIGNHIKDSLSGRPLSRLS
jgi:hypothetical protein